MFDLGIEGGTVVTPRGRSRLNVYVNDGKITMLSLARESCDSHADASNLLVMPGMVDSHVHLMDPGQPEREDFPTGTAAAARAGVTTIIEHTHGSPIRTPDEFRAKLSHVRNRSRVDFGLGAHAWPNQLNQVKPLWELGVAFLKAFTCTTHGVPGLNAGHLLRLFRTIAAIDAVCLVHCEDESLTAEAERELRSEGRNDGGVIPAWRNQDAELAALAVTGLLARRTEVRMVAAHLSTPEALAVVAREQAVGASITTESCPQYLTLLEGEVLEHGAFRKFTPPAHARSATELEMMWRALADGMIQIISSDHAPSTAAQKREGSIWDVHFGLPGLDTTLPILLDGAKAGRLSYERIAAVYSEMPARTYRLYPRKGRLEPGSDADIILVDPTERWTVRDEEIVSRAGWSPFSGRTLTGRAVQTYLRGSLIVDHGEVIGKPGIGQFLPGPGAKEVS